MMGCYWMIDQSSEKNPHDWLVSVGYNLQDSRIPSEGLAPKIPELNLYPSTSQMLKAGIFQATRQRNLLVASAR